MRVDLGCHEVPLSIKYEVSARNRSRDLDTNACGWKQFFFELLHRVGRSSTSRVQARGRQRLSLECSRHVPHPYSLASLRFEDSLIVERPVARNRLMSEVAISANPPWKESANNAQASSKIPSGRWLLLLKGWKESESARGSPCRCHYLGLA